MKDQITTFPWCKMPNTRKKVIKTVFKDEDDSAEETGDFSDSGSDAIISEESSSDNDEENENVASSSDEFKNTLKKSSKQRPLQKPKKFAKTLINKISKQSSVAAESDVTPALFSVKDLTDADKLLPSILNLSESDSSSDESPDPSSRNNKATSVFSQNQKHDTDDEAKTEYKDVWSHNMQVDSEEIARKAFLELEKHKSNIEETKAHLSNYTMKHQTEKEFNVQDLLAQGEDVMPKSETPVKKKRKSKKIKDESDSDVDDLEEVQESKTIPQHGLQLVVKLPDSICRKTKKVDVEMMMKRKMNRVKKEYQVYMHKVHVLCWIGHGNHISKVLNDQEVLAATLSLVPSKECYPGERVDMKYLEQITTWYKDKLTLKQDKNENKFRPKAPPLKEMLLGQIKNRVVTTKKYLVFIFVAMLRALGLQCRVMFNFVTLPIKPPSSELCSLSTKPMEDSEGSKQNSNAKNKKSKKATTSHSKNSKHQDKIPQVDGNDDNIINTFEIIMQVDGNDDSLPTPTRSTRSRKTKAGTKNATEDDISPPKRSKMSPSPKPSKTVSKGNKGQLKSESAEKSQVSKISINPPAISSRKTRSTINSNNIVKVDNVESQKKNVKKQPKLAPPKILVTKPKQDNNEQISEYFSNKINSDENNKVRQSRKRAITANPDVLQNTKEDIQKPNKSRTKSAPGYAVEKSKYFDSEAGSTPNQNKKCRLSLRNKASETKTEDQQRISHRELTKQKAKPKNDVKDDLINIIKGRVKESKEQSKKGKVKGKSKPESDDDSDFLPEETTARCKSDSDDEFKPTSKISPRPEPSTSKKIDRRVVSSDSETPTNKIDVWCEVFVEELEQWISVNVIKGKVHCAENLYTGATHPVCYVVGWDNNNYLKDLTRRYVPHWNTVTRKQRAEPAWWITALRPWLSPATARDKEENEQLDRMQLEAPLPKSIGEYKNHPLYALKRHLLKFEAIYPPDSASLGFVRGEAVYARECVHTCYSRDKWLKDAKVVRMREQPYKVVKARPKWDRLSNKLITDKPLEVFGPWQVQDYEPPTAENGIVPRNAYGNVELFKACMLPKGTVHIKLPGLNKVAKKLNIDCAPAMTGFDFNGGWSHPVYDGFVVCKEFEEIITEAWVEDQEDQERKEQEKTESRIYGHWRRLIKGLLIKERLKKKYGFQEPSTSKDNKKNKTGPRLVVKKK